MVSAEGVTPPEPIKRQYTYQDIADAKSVKVNTVKTWVRLGMIPSPVYTGYTARFTQEQFESIMLGTAKKGTYTRAASPREDIGRMGGNPHLRKLATLKKKSTKKPVAKKAPLKKSPPKKLVRRNK